MPERSESNTPESLISEFEKNPTADKLLSLVDSFESEKTVASRETHAPPL